MDVFTSTLKDKQVAHLFSEGDLFIRCKGHAGSSMANNNLQEFPVEQFDNVYMFMTRLDFQNNKIKSLPPDLFTKFKALEYLNLSKNNFTEVPKGIGNLTVLTEIDLSSNRYHIFVSLFYGLTQIN
jgi:Leucine-rich repeat (LRR) protein